MIVPYLFLLKMMLVLALISPVSAFTQETVLLKSQQLDEKLEKSSYHYDLMHQQ